MTEQEIYKVYECIDRNDAEMRELLVKLASEESPSAYKEGVDRVEEYIRDFAGKIGLRTETVFYENAGNSFRAYMNEGQGHAVALMGHMDTVHPVGAFGDKPVRVEGDYIYGPGVYDCKGGLVTALSVCRALYECGYKDREIRLLFSGDEEVGHRNSNGAEIFTAGTETLDAAINCESGLLDGRIVTGRKGGMTVKMVVQGLASHAGNAPEKGRSAIREAAYKIIDIDGQSDPDFITYSCGVIRGGTVPNQIPDHCEVEIDVRCRSRKDEEAARAFLDSAASKVYIEGTETKMIYPAKRIEPMEETEKNLKLFEEFRAASDYVGAVEPRTFFSGGGSDAAFTTAAGVPTICAAGIRGENHHSLSEYAYLPSISERAKIIVKMIADGCGGY